MRARHLARLVLVSWVILVQPDLAVSQEPKPKMPGVKPPVQLPPVSPPLEPDGLPEAARPLRVPREIPQSPELAIVEVRRIQSRAIRVGDVVPVDVIVRNSGNQPATVAVQSRFVSLGSARWTTSPAATIEPGETATWRLDLVATGGSVSGGALCGERSERVITLVEAPPSAAPAGYRPGNVETNSGLPFRDGNNADNERTVTFRFACTVILR